MVSVKPEIFKDFRWWHSNLKYSRISGDFSQSYIFKDFRWFPSNLYIQGFQVVSLKPEIFKDFRWFLLNLKYSRISGGFPQTYIYSKVSGDFPQTWNIQGFQVVSLKPEIFKNFRWFPLNLRYSRISGVSLKPEILKDFRWINGGGATNIALPRPFPPPFDRLCGPCKDVEQITVLKRIHSRQIQNF